MYAKLKILFKVIVLQTLHYVNKNNKFLTFLNHLENEEPNEKRKKYIGDLVCIKKLIKKVVLASDISSLIARFDLNLLPVGTQVLYLELSGEIS